MAAIDDMASTPGLLKRHLRQQTRARRRALSSEQRAEASAALVERLASLEVVRDARAIGLYAPFDGEIDPLGLLDLPVSRGKRAGWPCIHREGRRMDFRAATLALEVGTAGFAQAALESMVAGSMGIAAPTGAPIAPSALDVLVVPGLLFAPNGARLGMGGGYYDRYLIGFEGWTVGVGYDWQRVEALPVEPHDCLLDYVVTPSEVVRCGVD